MSSDHPQNSASTSLSAFKDKVKSVFGHTNDMPPASPSDTINTLNFDTNPKVSPQPSQRSFVRKTDDKQKLITLAMLEQKSTNPQDRHPSCQFYSDKRWLEPQFDKKNGRIAKPDELQGHMTEPIGPMDDEILDRIQGSITGMALGDALGAHVQYRPRSYLEANPVTDLVGGGTWGLKKGQFTNVTSMTLCLANSLISRRGFCAYDQLVRYKWWYKVGYMSSTGECFNSGNATRQSIDEFENHQKKTAKKYKIPLEDIDYLDDPEILEKFNIYCSEDGVAGNGALMRLAPVPLFFFRHPVYAIEYSGISGQISHGDRKAYDACRYYGALIVAALRGCNKKDLLDKKFYSKHKDWFGKEPLCSEIMSIAEGSFKNQGGYGAGIRGKGYIVNALEAALWAFWSDENSFEKGALAAVNLGDDTATTAAIYGQLAGAYYGYKNLPEKWLKEVYAIHFMLNLSKWIAYEGENWQPVKNASSTDQVTSSNISLHKLSIKESIPVIDSASKSDTNNKNPIAQQTSNESNKETTSLQAFLSPTAQEKSKVLVPEDCALWTCEDVCTWIKTLGEIYETYIDGFKQHNVNGHHLLRFVDDEALTEFGIKSRFNRQVILHGIQELKEKCSVPLSLNISAKNSFYDEFNGDFVPPLELSDTTYPNTVSCVLKPREDQVHKQLYNKILKWLGPLPSSIGIDYVELIHNSDLYRAFLQEIKRTESRQTQAVFQPHLERESNLAERQRVLDRLKNLTRQVHHNRSASIVRVWHGGHSNQLPDLLSDGFAALSKLDNGWFGTAMYFTSTAEYATKYTNSNGCLIMCYVVVLNPFPVIADDAPPGVSSSKFRFYGKGNYSNYQCHYIPVAPVNQHTASDFRPPRGGVQDAPYDELAVFQQSAILPQVVVHLKPQSASTTPVIPPDKKFLSRE